MRVLRISNPVEMLARGMVNVALPLVATVPCSWVKVKVSAVLVFLTATKWKLDLVASNNQRAATDGATLLLELLELLGAMLNCYVPECCHDSLRR